MFAGNLNKKIQIQRATVTKNSIGESVKSWANTITRFAYVRFLTTREYLIGNSAINTEVTAEIYLRSPVDLLATDRIVYDSRNYSIVGKPIPFEQYWIKVLVKEQS